MKADEWIHQNIELIDLIGKTELARIAFQAGYQEGQLEALAESQKMLDRIEQTIMGRRQT